MVTVKQTICLHRFVRDRNFDLSMRRKIPSTAALAAFEARDFRQVAQIIGKLLLEHPGDGPSLVLLSRALNAIIEPQDEFDPTWELPGK